MDTQTLTIPTVTNDGISPSTFSTRLITLHGDANRHLSERIPALNFRLRTSDSAYQSDWHVAGDPTLLIILHGHLAIELRDGTRQDFGPGGMFIAEDHLKPGSDFCDQTHGHRARVLGDVPLQALHLKLALHDTPNNN